MWGYQWGGLNLLLLTSSVAVLEMALCPLSVCLRQCPCLCLPASVCCPPGLAAAHFADNELWAYMRANEARVRAGQPRLPLLRTGLWRFSRPGCQT